MLYPYYAREARARDKDGNPTGYVETGWRIATGHRSFEGSLEILSIEFGRKVDVERAIEAFAREGITDRNGLAKIGMKKCREIASNAMAW